MTAADLSALLARGLGRFTDELEDGDGPSLAVWSNVIRCVPDDGIDERDLAPDARISKRLATAAVTGSARRGWITAEPEGGKNRRVHLTDAGRRGHQAWTERLAAFDEQWQGTPLRTALEQLVCRIPLELPHFPASYGAADPSATGGTFVQNRKRKEGVPAHGQDWAPVWRAEGDDSVSALPITALLSQALMAFTIDYEDHFPWPLNSTANVLVHITTERRPLADLPADHGITGNGKSLLERHLIVEVFKEGTTKLVALHYRGEQVMFNHPLRLEKTEAEWRGRYGGELIDALRAALADVAGADSSAYPDHVMGQLHNG